MPTEQGTGSSPFSAQYFTRANTGHSKGRRGTDEEKMSANLCFRLVGAEFRNAAVRQENSLLFVLAI